MNLAQTYETTILSDSEHSFQALVVPARSMPSGQNSQSDEIFKALELKILHDATPANLARDMAVLLTPELKAGELTDRLIRAANLGSKEEPSPDDAKFAAMICFDTVIPFENSPLSAESLAKLVTHASGPAIGAFVAFVIFGSTPLLFVAVPAGMIICGAAKGVATALEEGLKKRLMHWLKPTKPSPTMRTLHPAKKA
jgi:hypothetical protein